jgi:hypothetical protein
MPPLLTKPSNRREITRARAGKWKYWIGYLILDQGAQGYPRLGDNGPHIDQPIRKLGSTMPVSDRTHYGVLTNDIEQVEWYAAQYKTWGAAVYFENLYADDTDNFTPSLYDPADADLAQSELDERERRAAEWRAHCEVINANGAERRETIKAWCTESGCAMRFGYGCPRSEHKNGGCVELIKYYKGAERDNKSNAPAN